MPDDIMLYKDVATGAIYVAASRGHQGVTLRDLDSEPGDPDGVVVVSEWTLWQSLHAGIWHRIEYE